MKQADPCRSIPTLEIAEASPSLRDVAAYLRGVADATAALSDGCPPALGPLLAASSGAPERHDTMTGCGHLSRRTVPYGMDSAPQEELQNAPSDASLVDPTDKVPPMLEFIPVSWDAENGGERDSGVRLRVGRLSPEWYQLVDANVA